MRNVYALKHRQPDGSERIQEFDSREAAVNYLEHYGGVLVKRGAIDGEPGLWWIEQPDEGTNA